MIHIFFDCGSFGSTVEYAIRNFSNCPLGPISGRILDDGSMHSFEKQHHITSWKTLEDFLCVDRASDAITTPTYPFLDHKFDQVLQKFAGLPSWCSDHKILVYQPDLRAAELNLLFKYHKVCFGQEVSCGLDIIVGDNRHNLSGWDKNYQHWSEMQQWQLREWLSLFYPEWVTEFIKSKDQVDDTWLQITNTDLLFDTKKTLIKIIEFCGFTANQMIGDFVRDWQAAQQYIVDEFDLLDKIISNSLNQHPMQWSKLNVISEAILQQRFRSLGFELQCDGLNHFPSDTKNLYKLLVKV